MSKQIWKYDIEMSERFKLLMPVDHQVINVEKQNGSPKMWAIVDTSSKKEFIEFAIYGTGHPIKDGDVHVGSWIDGVYVWHLFKKPFG